MTSAKYSRRKGFCVFAWSALTVVSAALANAQTNTFPISGNVGIGTTNPQLQLDVFGNISVIPGYAFTLRNQYDNGNVGFLAAQGAPDNSVYLVNEQVGPLFFETSNVERMRIDPNGCVGIGTATPSTVSTQPDIGWGAPNVKMLGVLDNWGGQATPVTAVFAANDGSRFMEMSVLSKNVGGPATFLRARTSGTTDEFWVTYAGGAFFNGNVGIGTTNPTYPLAVNGTIEAKEIIVQTGWSDYVFDKNYHLTPLKQLDQQIQTEHHLPGIPTAEQVAKHGADLGAVESKLLAKVEELTLYVIDQDKRLDDQSRRIAQLERENATLRGSATGGGSPRPSSPN